MSRLRNYEVGHLGLLENTVLGANILFLEPFGMVMKLPTVLRKNPVKSCENGIPTIPTPVPGKNGNCQKLLGSQQLRSQTGSKTEDNEIEHQKAQGKEIKKILH